MQIAKYPILHALELALSEFFLGWGDSPQAIEEEKEKKRLPCGNWENQWKITGQRTFT
jgi:hypothetical protein